MLFLNMNSPQTRGHFSIQGFSPIEGFPCSVSIPSTTRRLLHVTDASAENDSCFVVELCTLLSAAVLYIQFGLGCL